MALFLRPYAITIECARSIFKLHNIIEIILPTAISFLLTMAELFLTVANLDIIWNSWFKIFPRTVFCMLTAPSSAVDCSPGLAVPADEIVNYPHRLLKLLSGRHAAKTCLPRSCGYIVAELSWIKDVQVSRMPVLGSRFVCRLGTGTRYVPLGCLPAHPM